MSKLEKITGKKPNKISYGKDPSIVLDNLVGIELELEKANLNKLSSIMPNYPLWVIVGDGSLRDHGVELVSIPVSGENLTHAIKELAEILSTACPEAVITERCSLHVHIDMRESTVRQLFNFLIVYTIFEDNLFHYVGYKRKGNPYCVPLTDAYNLQELMSNLTGTDTQVKRLINNWPKYSALNLKSLLKLGTVEIRMHPGTLQPKEILEWVNILLGIKKYVVTNPRRNTQSIIDQVCLDPENLVQSVFNDTFLNNLTEDNIHSMLDGARIAQQVYRYKEVQDLAMPLPAGTVQTRVPPRRPGIEALVRTDPVNPFDLYERST